MFLTNSQMLEGHYLIPPEPYDQQQKPTLDFIAQRDSTDHMDKPYQDASHIT